MLTTVLLLGYSMEPAAGELDINPSISLLLMLSQNNSESFESDTDILSVEPSIRTIYTSKRLFRNFSVENKQLQSNTTNESQSSSFTNYKYSGDISLIEEILSVTLARRQPYRSILSFQYLVNESYLGAGDMVTIMQERISVVTALT